MNNNKQSVAKKLFGKRVRLCLSLHECCLCKAAIRLGELYHDGGYENRAHVDCVDKARAGGPPMKHDHVCHCGGVMGAHITGGKGCFRMMTEAPEPMGNDFWRLQDVAGITGETLRQQWGYYQHSCGCWSRTCDERLNSVDHSEEDKP